MNACVTISIKQIVYKSDCSKGDVVLDLLAVCIIISVYRLPTSLIVPMVLIYDYCFSIGNN